MKKPNHIFKYLKGHVLKIRGLILDTLFPVECLGCKKPETWFCENCFKKLKFQNKTYCLHCYTKNNFGEFCSKCQKLFKLNGVLIAGNYNDKNLNLLIKNYKYQFNQELQNTLSNYLIIFLKNYFNKNRINYFDIPDMLLKFSETIVVPVPLHKKRLNFRGFNQSELLAQKVAEYFNLKLDNLHLKRTKHNKAQAKLKGKKKI